MKIVDSNITMMSSRSFSQTATTTRRMDFRAIPAPSQPGPEQADISPLAGLFTAVTSQAAEPATDLSDGLDPRLAVIKRILEALTGRKIAITSVQDSSGSPATQTAPSQGTDPQTPAPLGWGLEIRTSSAYDETESTRVEASGQVVTADGRSLDFTLAVGMERAFHTEETSLFRAGDALTDPLVINLASGPARLSDASFTFDINQDGLDETLPGLSNGSGFLVFDKNGDGRVSDGGELFGPETGNGFIELARLDMDKNGWVDEADPGFSALSYWEGPGTGLRSLGQVGIGALALANVDSTFSLTDTANRTRGMIRATGAYLREDGSVGSMQQVDLAV
ncbi:MAG: hypothetical protein V1793_24655 [Pseudomonadota bacterium]